MSYVALHDISTRFTCQVVVYRISNSLHHDNLTYPTIPNRMVNVLPLRPPGPDSIFTARVPAPHSGKKNLNLRNSLAGLGLGLGIPVSPRINHILRKSDPKNTLAARAPFPFPVSILRGWYTATVLHTLLCSALISIAEKREFRIATV